MKNLSRRNRRYLLLFVGQMLCIASVFGIGQNSDNADTNAVKVRLNEIYGTVFSAYNNNKKEPDTKEFNKKFTTADYQKWLRSVEKIDEKHPGEVGFMEVDHWIMAQDWDSVWMNVDSIKMISENEARADVTIFDRQIGTALTLPMKKENGVWLIDDFITIGDDSISEKTNMKEYVEKNEEK
jgi:hypothetical protein